MMDDRKQPVCLWLSVLLVSLCVALVSEAAERPTAFRGIRWGTPIHAIPGLQFDGALPGAAPEIATYTRPADDRMILGGEADAIRYLVAHDTLIGVAIRFRPDATGLAHCQQALTQLGELYGAPDQRRDIVSAPETRAHTRPGVAGAPRPFSTVQLWFATRETEATVEIACPAHAQSFAGYLRLLSTARAPQPPGVSVTSALP
jgi:hypothetical protein